MSRAEDDAIDALLARRGEEGDAAFALAIPRDGNPHIHDAEKRRAWFAKWDSAALDAARLMKASGAAALYNACFAAAALLRDMRNSPRTTSTRMPRYREVEVELTAALARAQAAAQTQRVTADSPQVSRGAQTKDTL